MSGACAVPVGAAESECEVEPVAEQPVKKDDIPAAEAREVAGPE